MGTIEEINKNKLLLGLIFGTCFALIDSFLFLVGEKTLDDYLKEITDLDKNERAVTLGGGAAAVALLLTGIIEQGIPPYIKYKKTVYSDFLGVICGTSLVVLLYHFFKN
jgi:hypothetical protein